jgi:hypothetical protein
MVSIGCNWQKLVCNRSEFVDHYARTAGFVPKKAFKPVQPNLLRLGFQTGRRGLWQFRPV